MNINLTKLHKYNINNTDKQIIEKIFPVDILLRIKEYTLDRKEIIEAEIFESLNKKDTYNQNYIYNLSSGNGKYLSFMKFFLLNKYKE